MIDLDSTLATLASDALAAVAREVQRGGFPDRAGSLVRQAAEIELMSSALQACWGGPFNGQAGRTAIVEDILRQISPRAVIETGTFRGVSTGWFAAHCDASVWSCELEEIYLLQARRRLAGLHNVILDHSDSRIFLRRVVSLLRADVPSFFYLDAHWKDDLPLREEIGIIFAAQPRAVVMIDDFRIPDDPGYAWDDYGPGARVDATALIGALPDGASLYVPALPSAEETGAKRGCCIIALELSETIDRCSLLRRRSLSDLMPQDRDDISPVTTEPQSSVLSSASKGSTPEDGSSVSSLRDEIVKINLDRAKRLHDINTLTRQIEEIRAKHLHDVDTLTRQIEEIEADRAQRLRDNQTLTAWVSRYQEELSLLRAELARRGGE